MFYNPEQWVAGNTVQISQFVKISTAADHTLTPCGANDAAYGISQTGMQQPPGLTGSNNLVAANANDNFLVYGMGCIAPITCGGTVTAGQFVNSDANGHAVAAANGINIVGQMVEAGANGTLAQCKVLGPGARQAP
jgi:hypothetical protein